MKKKYFLILSLIATLLLSGCETKTETDSTTASVTTKIEQTTETATQSDVSTETDADTSQPQSYSAYDWNGEPYIEINNNIPFFVDEYFLNYDISTIECNIFSSLDELGRCGEATAIIGTNIMPTEKRGEIGSVKPSGWHTSNYNEYPGLIDGNYLYNRCHLIAYMLTGENANPKNLITGTRYLNIEGMLPFENKVHDYIIDHPDNHVEYRVTPMFTGNNLIADGVLMEAWSIEDSGEMHFCVFCYNVQPYVDIDYATGDNHISDSYIQTNTVAEENWEDNSEWYTYILNENSKKIHLPSCSAVTDINESNKTETNRSYNELISEGYTPCGLCHPDNYDD